jgi:NAD(P)-dependent dehydrogenase (short-subunit alcohol dehydrogenase family)
MNSQPVQLTGAVAAVTGGARGIGLATAEALSRAGARVAVGDLDLDLARASAQSLPGDARAFSLDVTRRESFERFLDEVEGSLGPLSILVNNAGLMCISRLVDEDDAVTARQIDVNLHGVILGMKLALPRMLAGGQGHLVNIASGAGKAAFAGGATYCATKHAVVGLSEAARAELKGTPVHMTVVLPGVVNTELTSGLPSVPGPRPVEPAEVAAAIVRALERPQFEVYVPRRLGRAIKVMAALPDPVKQVVRRMSKADAVLLGADPVARAAYLERTEPPPAVAAERPQPPQAA